MQQFCSRLVKSHCGCNIAVMKIYHYVVKMKLYAISGVKTSDAELSPGPGMDSDAVIVEQAVAGYGSKRILNGRKRFDLDQTSSWAPVAQKFT